MSQGFIVTLDHERIYETGQLRSPGRLRRYFNEIDHKLDQGIMLGDQMIDKPDDYQKQQFVAVLLVNGLEVKDTNVINVMASYLSERYPELIEIKLMRQGDSFNLKLINKPG